MSHEVDGLIFQPVPDVSKFIPCDICSKCFFKCIFCSGDVLSRESTPVNCDTIHGSTIIASKS